MKIVLSIAVLLVPLCVVGISAFYLLWESFWRAQESDRRSSQTPLADE